MVERLIAPRCYNPHPHFASRTPVGVVWPYRRRKDDACHGGLGRRITDGEWSAILCRRLFSTGATAGLKVSANSMLPSNIQAVVVE
jgi:hypothetical protein